MRVRNGYASWMITIRRAQAQDAEALAVLFTHTRNTCMAYLPKLHTPDEDRAWMRNVVLPHCAVWIAEIDGRSVGFVAVEGSLLEHLYVHPDAQGRGVGTTLLNKAKELLPSGFHLWVFQRNAQARRFYERHELTLVRLTNGANNEERTPDAEYAWRPR